MKVEKEKEILKVLYQFLRHPLSHKEKLKEQYGTVGLVTLKRGRASGLSLGDGGFGWIERDGWEGFVCLCEESL